MIKHSAFLADPWKIIEKELNLDILAHTESIFALSNGHIGLRGNLDEGEPYGLPGTYLNSFYELRKLPYAEGAYGYPESSQTVIDVTNGKLIRLLVDDEPFDVRYGELQEHERELDFRDGLLRRTARWTSPAGRTIKISSERLVSFTQRAIAAIVYEVEAVDNPVRVVLQSELMANEDLPGGDGDPRGGMAPTSPLVSEEHQAQGTLGLLVHHTQASNLRIAAAMDHHVEGPAEMTVDAESFPDIVRVVVSANLQSGEKVRLVKFVAYGWSSQRSRPALHDQVIAALSAVRLTGWDGLRAEQRKYMDEFWERADVELTGSPKLQQALRFALFHVLQAGARGERRPIPAKGLTGPGYDGHTFWDTEIFVLPMLTLTSPNAAADALRWRQSTLDMARERAQQFGLRGAAFPWRTINGEECSGYWPASTAAFHINGDIAYAVVHYVGSTGDTAFEEEVGLELLVETARLWHSLGYYSETLDHFRIDGVTGPDEYSAIADNNVYTNLLAQHNLYAAADVAERYPAKAQKFKVTGDEIKAWRSAADKMFIPYDERLGVTPQAECFTEHAKWDFEHTPAENYPLFLHYPYFDIYRKQVVKQADLILAMQLFCNAFTPELKARNFAYYEPITVRDSSLSAPPQAVIAAEVGQLQLAHDYLGEAAFMDLDDLEHNVQGGVHIASLAGSWMALVSGFGGMRSNDSTISFAPRLPDEIETLCFHITFRNRHIRIEVTAKEATYSLLDGEPLKTWHHGTEITLSQENPVTKSIPAIKAGPRPNQPQGRPVIRLQD